MSEVFDNTEFDETQRTTVQDNAFPLHEETIPTEEESGDLESTYDHLTLFEKLKDNRWQVRRLRYSELSEFFETVNATYELGEELKPENMVPWIQNMIYEQNMIALVEALKALNAFLTHHPFSRPQLASFTGPLLDKL